MLNQQFIHLLCKFYEILLFSLSVAMETALEDTPTTENLPERQFLTWDYAIFTPIHMKIGNLFS